MKLKKKVLGITIASAIALGGIGGSMSAFAATPKAKVQSIISKKTVVNELGIDFKRHPSSITDEKSAITALKKIIEDQNKIEQQITEERFNAKLEIATAEAQNKEKQAELNYEESLSQVNVKSPDLPIIKREAQNRKTEELAQIKRDLTNTQNQLSTENKNEMEWIKQEQQQDQSMLAILEQAVLTHTDPKVKAKLAEDILNEYLKRGQFSIDENIDFQQEKIEYLKQLANLERNEERAALAASVKAKRITDTTYNQELKKVDIKHQRTIFEAEETGKRILKLESSQKAALKAIYDKSLPRIKKLKINALTKK